MHDRNAMRRGCQLFLSRHVIIRGIMGAYPYTTRCINISTSQQQQPAISRPHHRITPLIFTATGCHGNCNLPWRCISLMITHETELSIAMETFLIFPLRIGKGQLSRERGGAQVDNFHHQNAVTCLASSSLLSLQWGKVICTLLHL